MARSFYLEQYWLVTSLGVSSVIFLLSLFLSLPPFTYIVYRLFQELVFVCLSNNATKRGHECVSSSPPQPLVSVYTALSFLSLTQKNFRLCLFRVVSKDDDNNCVFSTPFFILEEAGLR